MTAQNNAFFGIDIGGTFTDAVMYKEGKISVFKVLTDRTNPEKSVIEAVRHLSEGSFILTHGSTLATNAVLERKGAPTALIATQGMADILYIARQDRLNLYEPEPTKREPLVKRQLCFEASERVDSKGTILKPLDMDKIREILLKASKSGVRSLAVCLLFSFKNEIHEQQIKESAEKLLDFVTISSDVLPEYREYERTSTTVLNAYISPILAGYISRLEEKLREIGASDFRIMESGGGIIPAAEAGKLGVRTILSGPAGGVAGAFGIARQAGLHKIITLDMGGTSTDVSLCDGFIGETREGEIDGFPVRVPMVDIETIGAGGGSIAYIDEGGSLKVGPRSAGADPGPAAFGKGEEPTVTDAHIVLGFLDPDDFIEDKVIIDKQRAINAVEKIAQKLEISAEETAAGIIRIALSHMEKTLRIVSLERGYDPSLFTMVPFGGAGPVHAPFLADSLGIKKILIPRYPGVLSALGMLLCNFRMDFTKTEILPVKSLSDEKYEEVFGQLYKKVYEFINRNSFSGVNLEFSFDARYKGQSFELNIPFGNADCVLMEDGFRLPAMPSLNPEKIITDFHSLHQKRYSFFRDKETIEIVNFRINLTAGNIKPVFESIPAGSGELETSGAVRRVILFDKEKPESMEIPVYLRDNLKADVVIPSPAIITQYDTTIFIPAGWNAITDKAGNLILEKA
jgi:N-methylhydantoinase A